MPLPTEPERVAVLDETSSQRRPPVRKTTVFSPHRCSTTRAVNVIRVYVVRAPYRSQPISWRRRYRVSICSSTDR